eukprot:TRINITY_DN660_c0_g1_i2.p1 TRINITY_DN660_c0_g1~~TRINITY_DN660_c0_g1_i2.p1  ORF type:complete len:1782 (-),score=540.16 TRINITY_DN660_c0_g1_i2:419-5764(-)
MPLGYEYSNSIHGNSYYYGPQNARLNNRARATSWASSSNEKGAYIEVDLRTQFQVDAIETQGRRNSGQWVETYQLRYSDDGVNWKDYVAKGDTAITTWRGNYYYGDSENSRHIFINPFKARYVRIYPLKYYSHMSLRWELYGKAVKSFPKMGSALGVQNGRINDNQIHVSGVHGNSNYYGKSRARLHHRGGAGSWCPTRAEKGSWIMVDLKGTATIRTIVTQGRYNSDQWWTRYEVEYSNDGIKYEKYRVSDKVYEFRGNYDRHTPHYQILPKPIKCRYIRLKVDKWRSFPSLRFELLGEFNSKKKMPRALGMQSGAIPTSAITASTYHNYYLGPKHARLHGRYAWCPRSSNQDDYLQVDLRADTHVGGVAVQGRKDANQYVTHFKLQYSSDMIVWKDYKVSEKVRWFAGPRDHNGVASHILDVPIRARGIRFRMQKNQYRGFPCMRVELYGKRIKSYSIGRPLGMQNGAIKDDQITRGGAGGDPGTYYGPNQGRLGHRGCRLPQRNRDSKGWMQVDFKGLVVLNGVATQGEFNHGYWLRRYYLKYSIDGQSWKTYSSKDGTPLRFHGNVDYKGVVQHILQFPIKCRYVRIVMDTYQGYPTVRAEFYGTRLSALKRGRPMYQQVSHVSMSASSSWDDWSAPSRARAWDRNGGWIPTPSYNIYRKPRDKTWIQMKYPGTAEINGVQIFPRYPSNAWVTKYTLSYSMDGVKFHDYKINGRVAIFKGNSARTYTGHTTLLLEPIRCRYLRLTPRGYYNYIALRWEAYGRMLHTVKLGPALGIQSGAIPNNKFTASTYWYNYYHSPLRSRLHMRSYGWCARHDKWTQGQQQWIQVDLSNPKIVGGIATQGRYNYPAWVTKFRLKYSVDGTKWHNYLDSKVLMGNNDRHTVVRHMLAQPFVARFVRLYPLGYYRMMCMRWELYGPPKYGGRFADNIGNPIGMQSKKIGDRAIKANDACSVAGNARNARLGITHGSGGWCPKDPSRKDNWLQVDAGELTEFGGIATEGSQIKRGMVLGYTLKYSNDSFTWSDYKEGKAVHRFTGSTIEPKPDKIFFPSIQSGAVRVHNGNWARGCQTIKFPTAYPKDIPVESIMVHLTGNERTYTGSGNHGSQAWWVEGIRHTHFRVCAVAQWGQNLSPNAYADWISFSKDSHHNQDIVYGETSRSSFSGQWCTTVSFGKTFPDYPAAFVTVNNRRNGGTQQHRSMSVWIRRKWKHQMTVCIRQGADNPNRNRDTRINISWMAMPMPNKCKSSLFKYGVTTQYRGLWRYKNVHCQWVNHGLGVTPTSVILSTENDRGAIFTWVENTQKHRFRWCSSTHPNDYLHNHKVNWMVFKNTRTDKPLSCWQKQDKKKDDAVVKHGFMHPFKARYVRIYPTPDPTQKAVYLRTELYTSRGWESGRKAREEAARQKALAIAAAKEAKLKAAADAAAAREKAAQAAIAAKLKKENAKLVAAQRSRNAAAIKALMAAIAKAKQEAADKKAAYEAKQKENAEAAAKIKAQIETLKNIEAQLRGHKRTIAVYNGKIANMRRRYVAAVAHYRRTRAKYVSIFARQRRAIAYLIRHLNYYKHHHADKTKKLDDLEQYMDKREDEHEALTKRQDAAEAATNAARARAAQLLADKNAGLHAENNHTIVGLEKLEHNLTRWLHILETKPTYGEKYLTAPPHVHRSTHCLETEDMVVGGKTKCAVVNDCDFPIFVTWTLQGLSGYEARKNRTPYSTILQPDANAVLYGYGTCAAMKVNSNSAPDGEHEHLFEKEEMEHGDDEEDHDDDEDDHDDDEDEHEVMEW